MSSEKSEETELAEALAQDVEGTFPRLVATYELSLFRFAVSRVQDQDLAHDIVQECWLSVYQALLRYSTQRIRSLKLQGWLLTIVKNKICTHFRKKNTVNIVSTEDIEESLTDEHELSLEEMLEIKSQIMQAAEVIEQLPLVSRTVLKLHLFQGLDYQEIAMQLSLTVGNVRTHVFRGLQELRKKLTTSIN